MSKTISLTIPEVIYNALECKADFYEMKVATFLASFLMQSAELEDSRLMIKGYVDEQKRKLAAGGDKSQERSAAEAAELAFSGEDPPAAGGDKSQGPPAAELALSSEDPPAAKPAEAEPAAVE